jgi:hypothetical protein
MGARSFLKAFGSIGLRVLGVATGLEPEVEAFMGGVAGSRIQATATTAADTFNGIATAVLNQETAFSAAYGNAQTGPQKATAVAAIITPDVVAAIDKMTGNAKIADAQGTQKAILTLVGAVADLLNARAPAAK